MRQIRHDPMSTIASVVVISGLMGLLFHSLLLAQDFPADITRGKGVYQHNCQNCHGVGGSQDRAGQLPPFFVFSEIRRRVAADH